MGPEEAAHLQKTIDEGIDMASKRMHFLEVAQVEGWDVAKCLEKNELFLELPEDIQKQLKRAKKDAKLEESLKVKTRRALVCRCRRASGAVVGGPLPLHATCVRSTTPTTGDDDIPTHATECCQHLPLASTTFPLMLQYVDSVYHWRCRHTNHPCYALLHFSVACPSRHRLKYAQRHTPTPLGTHTGSGVDALITYKGKHLVQCKRRDLFFGAQGSS
jgi:hypothetical protein